MNQTTQSSRATAIANRDDAIAASAQRAAATPQGRSVSALQAMASRLQISQQNLENTLRQTVFRDANNEEFAALVIVANEYGLNPLTKEIYAFKGKGAIMPMVSVDGWIRIINTHPQFDGLEFNYFEDERGKTSAIEAVIYRKDRTRPIRVTEYLDECKKDTDPWKTWPRRMLRHKALIQCARLAFGFAGIYDDDDIVAYPADADNPHMRQARVVAMPTDPQLEQQPVGEPEPAEAYDPDTGEVFEEGTPEPQQATTFEPDSDEAICNGIIKRVLTAELLIDVNQIEADWKKIAFQIENDDLCAMVSREIAAAKVRLGGIRLGDNGAR